MKKMLSSLLIIILFSCDQSYKPVNPIPSNRQKIWQEIYPWPQSGFAFRHESSTKKHSIYSGEGDYLFSVIKESKATNSLFQKNIMAILMLLAILFLLMHGLQQQLFFILFYNTLNIILMTKQLIGQFLLFIMTIQLMEQHQQCLSLYYCLFFLLKLYLKKLK